MKVLLFVQNGDARPRVAHANCPDSISRRSGQRVRDACATRHYLSNIVLRLTWGRWAVMARGANRWWLVECENAKAGRQVIEWERTGGPDPVLNKPCPFGRILATGGVA